MPPPSSWLALLAALWAGTSPWARAGDPVLPLPEADREIIERNLGPGRVGAALPAPVITDPVQWFPLLPGARSFKIVHGPRESHREDFRLTPEPRGSGRDGWRYRMGEAEEALLETRPDGGIVLSGTLELKDGALARYTPGEPLLLPGIAPGEERRQRMEVRVYDGDTPDEIRHRGLLSVVHRYVGAYRFTAPWGAVPAVLMKSTFVGSVGPARLDDVQYRFFAARLGLVAALEYRHVSAFLLYRTNTETARILAEPPDCRPVAAGTASSPC